MPQSQLPNDIDVSASLRKLETAQLKDMLRHAAGPLVLELSQRAPIRLEIDSEAVQRGDARSVLVIHDED